jgi:Glycosyl transferase family 2
MEEAVFISICIPAYKRVSFLKRLLDSIECLSYRQFEAVVTDDSPDNNVSDLCHSHPFSTVFRYFKNEKKLGTPENWNESIRREGGGWIMWNPKTLLASNWIRPPSAILHKNIQGILYDSALKWLVDVDFDIRYIQHSKPLSKAVLETGNYSKFFMLSHYTIHYAKLNRG